MNREELLFAIKAADKAYYEDDAPTITDEAYDALRKEYIDKFHKTPRQAVEIEG